MGDTFWESICKNVGYKLIDALPGMIRRDHSQVSLPPLDNYDSGEQVEGFCNNFLDYDVGNVVLNLSDSKLSGLDTISLYPPNGRSGQITFTKKNTKMKIPLLFADITMAGKWEMRHKCQTDDPKEVGEKDARWENLTGGFTLHLQQVQVTMIITLDDDEGQATKVVLKLTDKTKTWSQQPVFDPDTDVTYDANVKSSQRMGIKFVLKAANVAEQLRAPAKEFIEGDQLAGEIKKMINQQLAAYA